MKLFEIVIDFPAEKIEQAIITACSPFKSKEISANYNGDIIGIWNRYEFKQPELMVLLDKVKDKKYKIHILGKPNVQEKIMQDFLKYLNFSKENITFL